jgi:hypothetical protein
MPRPLAFVGTILFVKMDNLWTMKETMWVSVHRLKRGNLQQDQDLHHSWCRAAFLRGLDGLPPGSGRPSSGAWTAFLQSKNGLPPAPGQATSGPERPSSSSRTGCLRGQSAHPPSPGQVAFVARAAFLQLQDGLPPWPGRPSSSSRTGYLRGLGGLPVNGYQVSQASLDGVGHHFRPCLEIGGQ